MQGTYYKKIIVNLATVNLFVVQILCASTRTNSANSEAITISDPNEFESWWVINYGTFTNNTILPPEIPASVNAWYIHGKNSSTTFSVTFSITDNSCYTTSASIEFKYYSYNSAATVFPVEDASGDPFFHLPISSNSDEWTISDTLSIAFVGDGDNQITVIGEILETGYFAFDEIVIRIDGATTGCTTITTEATTTEAVTEDTTGTTENTETPEEDITLTITTVEVTTQTETITDAPTTTEFVTFPPTATSTIEIPDTEETELTKPEVSTDPSFTTSDSTTTIITVTAESTTLETTTEDDVTTDFTDSITPESTSNSSPPSDFTTEASSSPSTGTGDQTSESSSTTASSSFTTTIPDITATTPITHPPSSPATTATTRTTDISSTRPSRPSTTQAGSTLSSVTSPTIPPITTTTRRMIPEEGLTTQEVILYIVVPTLALVAILSIGFSLLYFTQCGSRMFSIGGKSSHLVTHSANNGTDAWYPMRGHAGYNHQQSGLSPHNGQASVGMSPASVYEFPRAQMDQASTSQNIMRRFPISVQPQ